MPTNVRTFQINEVESVVEEDVDVDEYELRKLRSLAKLAYDCATKSLWTKAYGGRPLNGEDRTR